MSVVQSAIFKGAAARPLCLQGDLGRQNAARRTLRRPWRSVMSNAVEAGSAGFSRLERGACIVTQGTGITPPDLDLASAIREAEEAEEAVRQRVLELQAAETEHGAAKARLADLKNAMRNAGSGSTATSANQKQQGAPARGLLAARKNLGMKKRSAAAMARLATARQGSRAGPTVSTPPPGSTTAASVQRRPEGAKSNSNDALSSRDGNSRSSASAAAAPPAKGSLAVRKKLELKKKSVAAMARLATTRKQQGVSSQSEPPRSAAPDTQSTASSLPSGPGSQAMAPDGNTSPPPGPPIDRYRVMRIKVMPLMRSWVTRPEEKSSAEFESLSDLSFTDAEEVYVDFDEDDALASLDEDDLCHPLADRKKIFVMSDCTGESAAKTVRGALMQFDNCNTNIAMKPSMVVFRFLTSERKAVAIIERAAQENAMVVFTLVNPLMVNTVKAACHFYHVRCEDLWSDLVNSMSAYLETSPLGIPGGLKEDASMVPTPSRLGRDYFKLISAVEYTRKMDDGANPHEWKDADLMILGVSRSGKTPLCIYLGQRGYKVANLPLVPNLPIPKELFEIDQRKIVGLLIDPTVLQAIRANRMDTMGLRGEQSDYNQLSKVREEVNWVKQFYAGNPDWLVLDQTYQSVEETSARILRVMSERLGEENSKWSKEISGDMLEIIR